MLIRMMSQPRSNTDADLLELADRLEAGLQELKTQEQPSEGKCEACEDEEDGDLVESSGN